MARAKTKMAKMAAHRPAAVRVLMIYLVFLLLLDVRISLSIIQYDEQANNLCMLQPLPSAGVPDNESTPGNIARTSTLVGGDLVLFTNTGDGPLNPITISARPLARQQDQ